MFCDTCHWYTAGEKICPHCGAEQSPKKADIFNLPGGVSVLDDTFLDKPLAEASKAAPAPVPVPKPAPAPRPAPAPKPAPVPQAPPPAPKPMPAPAPRPAPAPVSAPRPAPPPSNSSKQGIKALVIVLVGVFALLIVLVIADQAGSSTNYGYDNNYIWHDDDEDDDWYDDWYEQYGPSLESAQVGDVITFGNVQWLVLDEDLSGDLLLMREDAVYLRPEEIDEYPGEKEYYGDVACLGGVEFGIMEYHRILRMFLLSADEMAEYGIEPPEVWDDELIPVRPAIWVNTRL